MSISSATDHLVSTRRVQPRHMVGALLLAVGLIAVVVAIAISSAASSVSRPSAGPATITATPSQPTVQPTGAPLSSVPGQTFRDPATHALLPVGIPTLQHGETRHGGQ